MKTQRMKTLRENDMTAHELARLLMEGPDVLVYYEDDQGPLVVQGLSPHNLYFRKGEDLKHRRAFRSSCYNKRDGFIEAIEIV